MFCVVPVAKAHPRYRRRYRSRSSENGALLCRSKAAGSVKTFSNMTNLHDDGPSARAQIYVGRNGYAECADREVGGRGRRVYFVDTGGREIARRTINERRPPCRHYVRG